MQVNLGNKKRHHLSAALCLLICFTLAVTGCAVKKTIITPEPGRPVPSYPPKTAVPPAPPPAPKPAYPLSGQSYIINGKEYFVLASAESYIEEGIASWYGDKFHGRKTSSGEIYDMYALTAAHKTLPLGTWVKVTNLDNQKELTVRINDRGPFIQGRIIDMSLTGARQLDMVGPGTAPVKIEALGREQQELVDGRMMMVLVKPRSYAKGRFTIQVGSFGVKANAEALASRMEQLYDKARIVPVQLDTGLFYRVQVSEKNNIADAFELRKRLEADGFKDCYIVMMDS